MKMKYELKRKIYELIVLGLMIIPLTISILADLSLINFPRALLINPNDNESFFMSLLTVQATISVTGTAIVSLLTAVVSKEYYGVPVSKFITKINPWFLKHKYVIVLELIITALNYFTVAFSFYNVSVAIFVCSVFLLIYLFKDDTVVFLGEKSVKLRIAEYILNGNCDDNMDSLFAQNMELIDKGQFVSLKDNLGLTKQLLTREFDDYRKTNNYNNIEIIEDHLTELYKIIVRIRHSDENNYFLSYLYSLYAIANEKKIYFELWWKIPNIYYRSLKNISYYDYKEDYYILRFHPLLYKNQEYNRFINDEKYDEYRNPLNYYSGRIYRELFLNENDSLLYNKQKEITRDLYDVVYDKLMYNSWDEDKTIYKKFKLGVAIELSSFLKASVDNIAVDNVWDDLFSDIVYADKKEKLKIPVICILIYFYYLIEKEPLADNKPAQKNARHIIKKFYRMINECFWYIRLDDIVNNIKQVSHIMESWEWFESGKAKFVTMEYAVSDFILFWALNVYYREDELKKVADDVFDKKSTFALYNRFFSNEDSFEKQYTPFKNLFFKDSDNTEEVKEQFLDFVYRRYKAECIEQAEKNEPRKEQIESYAQEFKLICEKVVKNNSMLYSDKQICDEDDVMYKSIKLFVGNFDVPIEKFHYNFIENHLLHCLIHLYIDLVKDKTDSSVIQCNNNDVQKQIIETLGKQNIKYNIMLGNKVTFFREKNRNMLSEYLQNNSIIKIPFQNSNNEYYFINSAKAHIKIENINVITRDLNNKEIQNYFKTDKDNKSWFNVTNDIYIPFDYDEIINYIHKTRKVFEISIEVTYKFDNKTIGMHLIVK